jgi:hypothetical protein
VRVEPDRAPLDLHRLWDGLITSSNNVNRLRRIASDLRNRFPRAGLNELRSTDTESWANESYEAAIQIAYQNGKLRGTPKGQHRDCREITDVAVLPSGYAVSARNVADRRIVLASYRLADFLASLFRM